MKLLVVFALCLLSFSAAEDSTTTAPSFNYDPTVTTKLILYPIYENETGKPAVLRARKFIKDLKLFNLLNQVEQAAFFKGEEGHKLQIEMSSCLQANKIFSQWALTSQPNGGDGLWTKDEMQNIQKMTLEKTFRDIYQNLY